MTVPDSQGSALEGPYLIPPSNPRHQPVPWRTILAVALVAALSYAGFLLLRELARVITWLVVAGFFTVVLAPAVDALQRRMHLRRALATAIVFLLGLVALVGLLYVFIRPVITSVSSFVDDLPSLVEDAKQGRGPVGELVSRYNLEEYVQDNQARFQSALRTAGAPALHVAQSVFSGIVAFITIMVLTFLMILRGPELCTGALALVAPAHRERVRIIAADASKAVSGYMFGNLVISLIAGICTYVFLRIVGVPYAEVLALWVGFADLIPLVGATMGAIPTVGFAFGHSVTAGVATLIFYIVYQQFENHVLQVTVMSRTVDVNPLAVIVSVLVGVELFGFLGAALAIPAAGVIQVVVRSLYELRRGTGGAGPVVTDGTEKIPIAPVDGLAPPVVGGAAPLNGGAPPNGTPGPPEAEAAEQPTVERGG
jgi:predicted PurR-regulated permease PerM